MPEFAAGLSELRVREERFVFSDSDDFSLAREMLLRVPELRGGPRYT